MGRIDIKIKAREAIKKIRKPVARPTKVQKSKKAYNRKVSKKIIQKVLEEGEA